MGLLCAKQNIGKLKYCTLRISGTAVCRTKDRKSQQNTYFQMLRDSCAQNKTLEISNTAISEILGLLCAEQDVGNLNQCTFSNSGTPVRRTKRLKYPKCALQESWDSQAQNKTSEISKNALSKIMRLLCAEEHVGNIKFPLSCFVGLRLAEQNVENLKKC